MMLGFSSGMAPEELTGATARAINAKVMKTICFTRDSRRSFLDNGNAKVGPGAPIIQVGEFLESKPTEHASKGVVAPSF